MPHRVNPFDTEAVRYDRWFDSPRGRSIFALEVACLEGLRGEPRGRWLEVGVGTGRFAQALGVEEGVDPSQAVLRLARRRGVRTVRARGENLPYPDAAFDGILMVVTICFLADPEATLRECRRVLKPAGSLLLGLVPADSPWGRLYARKGREGHLFYSSARFYTCEQVITLAREGGFSFEGARSCLFSPPEGPLTDLSIREGVLSDAGFVALRFSTKGGNPTSGGREGYH